MLRGNNWFEVFRNFFSRGPAHVGPLQASGVAVVQVAPISAFAAAMNGAEDKNVAALDFVRTLRDGDLNFKTFADIILETKNNPQYEYCRIVESFFNERERVVFYAFVRNIAPDRNNELLQIFDNKLRSRSEQGFLPPAYGSWTAGPLSGDVGRSNSSGRSGSSGYQLRNN